MANTVAYFAMTSVMKKNFFTTLKLELGAKTCQGQKKFYSIDTWTTLDKFPVTNTLAYFMLPSVTKQKKFDNIETQTRKITCL